MKWAKKTGRLPVKSWCEEVEAGAMEGIVFAGYGKDRKGNPDYGEAPQAYKNIDAVMEAQSDLVEIAHRLRPLAVVKG